MYENLIALCNFGPQVLAAEEHAPKCSIVIREREIDVARLRAREISYFSGYPQITQELIGFDQLAQIPGNLTDSIRCNRKCVASRIRWA
jgi:hypothetical protein